MWEGIQSFLFLLIMEFFDLTYSYESKILSQYTNCTLDGAIIKYSKTENFPLEMIMIA